MSDIITSPDELRQLIKDGLFFNFCVSIALNKGYKGVMNERQPVKFTVGDYLVQFDYEQGCFMLSHKEYFARVIHAYLNEVFFIGEKEEEVIAELLSELEKELEKPTPINTPEP